MNNIALSIIAIINVIACSVAIVNYINDTGDKVALIILKAEQEKEFQNVYRIIQEIKKEKEEKTK